MGLELKKKAAIRTERLILKPYSQQDVEQLVGLLTNREITKNFMVPDFDTIDQATKLAEKLVTFSQVEDLIHLEYGIHLNDVLIGFINDCGVEGTTIEIGYVIHPNFQGNGYATEAVRAVMNELREMGFTKVTAGFFSENIASRSVMVKCGMKQSDFVDEKDYHGVIHKCLYYEKCF